MGYVLYKMSLNGLSVGLCYLTSDECVGSAGSAGCTHSSSFGHLKYGKMQGRKILKQEIMTKG